MYLKCVNIFDKESVFFCKYAPVDVLACVNNIMLLINFSLRYNIGSFRNNAYNCAEITN